MHFRALLCAICGTAHKGHPFMAFGTHPVCRVIAADCIVVWRLGVPSCVPLLDKVWRLAGKGVVGAHSSTGAKGAACAFVQSLTGSLPAAVD